MQSTDLWRIGLSGVLVFAASSVFSFDAQAEQPHYRVDLRAPKHLTTCNDVDGLRDVLSLTLPDWLLEPPISRTLEIRVDRAAGGGFKADITASDLSGQVIGSFRETYPHETECFKVLHRVAVATAIWLNKLDGSFERPADPAPAHPPACPPATSPPQCPACETPRPAPPKPAPPERRGFVGAGGFVWWGAAPAAVMGLQLAGGLRAWRSWSFEFDLRGTFQADAVLNVTPVRVHSVISVAFAPCYRIGAFGACARGLFSNLWVEPITLASSDVETFRAVGIGPRVFLGKHIDERWSVRIDADLVVPFGLPSIDPRSQLRWRSPSISGGASASLFAWF